MKLCSLPIQQSRFLHHDHGHQHEDQHPSIRQWQAQQTRIAELGSDTRSLATRVHQIQTTLGQHITAEEE